MSERPLITVRDIRRELDETGLALVELDPGEVGRPRLVVRAVHSDLVRRAAPELRVAHLRAQLRERGAVGIEWCVVLAGDGPYRTPGSGG